MKLLLDVMLGSLATHLRMLGHDAASALDRDVEADDALLAIAEREDRTLLTRDVDLAGRSDRAVLLRSTAVDDQLDELRAAGLELSLDHPERCSRCNAELTELESTADTPGSVPAADETPVWWCPECDKHYWQGSHWTDVERRIDELESG